MNHLEIRILNNARLRKSGCLFIAAALLCASVPHAVGQAADAAPVSSADLEKIEAAIPTTASAAPRQARHVLIFSRTEGFVHSCIPIANEALKRLGEKTGAYSSEIGDDMSMFDRENLERFDAVLFNNSTELSFPDPAHRRNLLAFVESGKGLIGIHAASDSFYDWPEAASMLGGQFDLHPWTGDGTWAVKVEEPAHPVTRSLEQPSFLVTDEIYQIKGDYSRSTHRVLLSLDMSQDRNWQINREQIHRTDNDFAVAWIKPYGQGRVFYSSLGHNPHIFWDSSILGHYLAGIQYALGDLEVDDAPSRAALEGLTGPYAVMAHYEIGQDREVLAALEESLRTASPDERGAIERDLLRVVEHPDATLQGRIFACRLLRRIGSAQSIPVLAPMLSDPVIAQAARFALSGIPGPEAESALRAALGRLDGDLLIGVIHLVSLRRDREAVPALAERAASPALGVAEAAITALGRIGGEAAAQALVDMPDRRELAGAWYDALLAVAESLAAAGNSDAAQSMYLEMAAAGYPPLVRAAAIQGATAMNANEALPLVVRGLRDPEIAVRKAAARAVEFIPGATASAAFTGELPGLAPDLKVVMISALAKRGDPALAPVMIEEIDNEDEGVRLAAVAALGDLGDAESADLLLGLISSGGDAHDVALESIARLRGDQVDAKILGKLDPREPKMCVAAIEACAARGAIGVVEPCLRLALGDNGIIRQAAFAALGALAPAPDVEALVELAMTPIGGTGAGRALVETYRRLGDDATMGPITSALAGADDRQTRALLKALGGMGGDQAAEIVLAYVDDPRPDVQSDAIRTLAGWEDAGPAEDLLRIARETDDEKLHVIVLRGYLRMASRLAEEDEEEEDVTGEEVADMYRAALATARRSEERGQALNALGRVGGPSALANIVPYLKDPGLHSDAEEAVREMMESMGPRDAALAIGALNEIVATAGPGELETQATALIESSGGIVGQWAIAGPYQENGRRGSELFDVAFDPEQDGADVDWQIVTVSSNLVLDFLRVFDDDEAADCAVYARVLVTVPEAQPARLSLGSDDGIKVWLNGELVHAVNSQRALRVDEDRVDVRLNKGDNVVLMKVTQLGGGWEASARFVGSDGGPIPGFRSSAEP